MKHLEELIQKRKEEKKSKAIAKNRESENVTFDNFKKAADKIGITNALDDFINGKGFGNKVKPLHLNQNQYDALFSYFYANGKKYFQNQNILNGSGMEESMQNE